jgi:hypothetical protein
VLKSFGADPEFMLVDPNGKYISAIGVIPGTKAKKVDLGNSSFAFYDNVLVEVNIKPSSSRDDTIRNFRDCFKRLSKLTGKNRLVVQASQVYPASECLHEDAREFSCKPEWCLYVTNSYNQLRKLKPIRCPRNNFRSAGGHVHVGSPLACKLGKPLQTLKMLDLFLGGVSVLIDHDPTSLARKKLYGGAGNHRPCPKYGIEYRTLSNFWISSPELVMVIYDLTNLAMKLVNRADEIWDQIDPAGLRDYINKSDKTAILKKIFPIISAEMSRSLLENIKFLFEPREFDFYKEWGI